MFNVTGNVEDQDLFNLAREIRNDYIARNINI